MIPSRHQIVRALEGKPRASGDDPEGRDYVLALDAVNPARAGMIPPHPRYQPRTTGKPRASGDDPVPSRSSTA